MAAPCPLNPCCGGVSPCNRQACVSVFYSSCRSGGIAGVPVTISGGGTAYSGTTDGTGSFCTPTGIASGTWTATIDLSGVAGHACYQFSSSQSTTFTSGDCTKHTLSFPVILDQTTTPPCICVQGCGDVETISTSATFSFSDTVLGGTTLTYAGYTGTGPYLFGWQGTLSYSYPGCAGSPECCPATTITVKVLLRFQGTVGSFNIVSPPTLSISYPAKLWTGAAVVALGCASGISATDCPNTSTSFDGVNSSLSTCALNPLDVTFANSSPAMSGGYALFCGGGSTSTVTGP